MHELISLMNEASNVVENLLIEDEITIEKYGELLGLLRQVSGTAVDR